MQQNRGKGRLDLRTLGELLDLCKICEIDVANACPINQLGTTPVKEALAKYANTEEQPAADVLALLKRYID